MGCSSTNALKEKSYPKTGDPKKDFFYCFDEEEIKLIEERKNKSSDPSYTDLYSRYEFDYAGGRDDVIVKQYLAVHLGNEFNGEYTNEDIQKLFMTSFEMISFKVNNIKQAKLPEFGNQENGWVYCWITCKISENDRIEPYKDMLVLELTYKIQQRRIYHTRTICLDKREEPYTSTVIIYYNKNQIEVESVYGENYTSLKNGEKYFNKKDNIFHIKNKGKIQFSKEEEALIKKKFTAEEISNIYTALDKIGIFRDNNNLIFESFKYTLNKDSGKGEGKMLLLNDIKFGNNINGCDFNIAINELKLNDKVIEKKPQEYMEENIEVPENYYKSQNGANNVMLHDLKSLAIIEYKIELVKNTESDETAYPFDFKKLIGIEYISGGYYNFQIVPNNADISFEPEEGNYKPKKSANLIQFSGFYDVNLKDYNDVQYLKEKGEEYDNYEDIKYNKDTREREWLNNKLEDFHPSKFNLN